MNFEGRVTVDIFGGAVPAVKVAFTQPGDIDRVLKGKTPAEALQIVPAVFSLCAMAQVQAAQTALDAATGVEPNAYFLAARQCLTEMEGLRENALRIALDWPRFVDEPVDGQHLKALMRLVPELRAALSGILEAGAAASASVFNADRALAMIDAADVLLEKLVFGEPLAVWRARRDAGQVKDWASRSKTVAARLLARISAAGWDGAGATPVVALEAVDAEAVQRWLRETDDGWSELGLDIQRDVPETTLLARHAQDTRFVAGEAGGLCAGGPCAGGLWQRLAARLVELSILPERMRRLIDQQMPADRGRVLWAGAGLGEVTAARGRLAHVAVVERGRIADYRIVPPTRWNFAANGVAARVVTNIATAQAGNMRYLAELAVNAIDPCVGHKVRVH